MPLLLVTALTLGTLGKVILGIAVIRVHTRLSKEHQVDRAVVTEIKHEHLLGIIGIIGIIIGYILEMLFYAGVDFTGVGL